VFFPIVSIASLDTFCQRSYVFLQPRFVPGAFSRFGKSHQFFAALCSRVCPLTPAAQSAYVTSLASQLIVAIRTFVNLHPNIHTNSTPPDIVINLLLANLLSQGTITPALYFNIIEQLLYSSRQDLILTLFQNYNQFRPNLPQVTFVRSDVAVRSPTAVVPVNEVSVNPPFDIIDTQTAQTSTILSQLSVPNSQGSSPSTHHRPHAHRIRYDPISDLSLHT
jgi:hypothetical protein